MDFVGDIGPDAERVPVSDPLADVAELGAPPALAELREYMEDTDIRLFSLSAPEFRGLIADSGNGDGRLPSVMMLGDSLGRS
jgi:hypothetical protein